MSNKENKQTLYGATFDRKETPATEVEIEEDPTSGDASAAPKQSDTPNRAISTKTNTLGCF